jgi:polysaccharide chain length determinant protein (PEP-CTERM system associated)
MKIGINGTQAFLALLIRRKWWIVAPFLALSSAAALLVHVLPETYVSETLILVRPRDVPEQFVMDLIAGSTQQRLTGIEQTLRSRTNLLQVLREFEDRLPEFQPLNIDQKVDRLNTHIQINFQLDEGRTPQPTLTSLQISYQNRDPALAQEITSKLTALFIEQDHRVRETQVFGTTEFLSAELQKISEQLALSEEELKTLKSQNQFELPEQLETNLRTLDRLTLQRQTNAEALDRSAALRLNLERQILETPPTLTETGPVALPPAIAANPRLEEYRLARSQYEQADAMYTDRHPVVQAAKARLQRLEAEIPPELRNGTPEGAPASISSSRQVPNPLYQSLTVQLQEVKTDLAIRERERAYIEVELDKFSRRVEGTPQTEQRIAAVLRRNTDLQAQYDDLKNKLSSARLAESLESKQKGSQFVIVDPANYPLVPSKPNKLLVLIAGIMGSLAASIGIAAAVDVALQRVWTQSEIEAFWGTPVLIEIPEILTDSDLAQQRKRKFTFAASSVGAATAYAACLYFVYINHTLILQRLDPVLQKLVYR